MTSAVLWDGDRNGPTVLVFDPAPSRRWHEMPGAWRELTDRRQVVWCCFAEERVLAEVDRLLADADAFGRPIDVVLHADPPAVVELLRRHGECVRALVVVDAEPGDLHAIAELHDVRVVTVGEPHTPPRSFPGGDVSTDVTVALDSLDRADIRQAASPRRRRR